MTEEYDPTKVRLPPAGANVKATLRSFIERIERLEQEKRTIADDIKDVYAEAKGIGFDTKTIRKVIAIRKMDRESYEEQQAILETYLVALGLLPDRGGDDTFN